ncbi:cohesin subunit SA-2 [Drosophila tropicalis]|uniref:cohesin subunit SA-2 n=1 Tax=Drosophila tropicalis TaxID=46794 RepID=UPI0035ABA947
MSNEASDISVADDDIISEDVELTEEDDVLCDAIGGDIDGSHDGGLESDVDEDENGGKSTSLFKQATNKGLRNEDIVANWIAQYESNPNNALVAFLQFVIEASGSHYKLPQDTVLILESYTDILIAGTTHFCNSSVYYPLTKKSGAAFTRILENFVKCFFMTLDATTIINDDVFLDHVTGFIMACSQSKVRPFRHTSTMIGLKILTIMNDLTGIEYDKLEALWLKMFECVFRERSRDVVNDIRYLCIAECFVWLESYPQSFLKPQHIEYIFQALRDECGKVKECAIKALDQLYAKSDMRKTCLELCKNFINDLLAIILEKENELGEHAINLLEKFCRSSSHMLDESQYLLVEQLIFAANRGLAQAAAKMFQYRRLMDENYPPERHIGIIIEFFHEFGQHEHAAYLVDAFIDFNASIIDWSIMVQMLIQQPSAMESPAISTLIEILTRGVEQAVTGRIPAGRYTKTLVRKPKENAQDLATIVLAPAMPQLLAQHGSSSENLVNLLQLPQYINIVHYELDDNREQLDQLMELIEQIVFHNENISVLRVAAATLECIYQIPSTSAHSKELLTKAVNNYESAYLSWENSSQNPQRLLISLRVLASLHGYFDLKDWNIADTVRLRLQNQNLPDEALDLHLELGFFSLSWDLKKVNSLASDNVDVDDLCIGLKENLESFFFASFMVIENNSNLTITANAFASSCDLLVLFGDQLRQNTNQSIRSLQYHSTVNEFEFFDSFVTRNVFQELPTQDSFDDLHSKRRILSGYCKLVSFNLMPTMRACIIFQHYHRFFNFFGDILNATMELALKINIINYGMTILHTCLCVYKKIKEMGNDEVANPITQSTEFIELIQLARRLAETFNSNLLKNRSAVVTLHRAGILFVSEIAPNRPTAAPDNLPFLRILEEFVPQLLSQDKLDILTFLECIEEPALPSCSRQDWEPLTNYRMALEMALRKSCRRREFNERMNYGTS